MNKFKELKEAMNNPPPERLAKIEYQSHFLQMVGISAVCIVLILKGMWYIIFAFTFGLGISYAQGMAAYKKYVTIMQYKEPEKAKEFELDISPTRRRSKIIESVISQSVVLAAIITVILTVMTIGFGYSRWILMIVYPVTITLYYIIIYYFFLYWICYPEYKRRLKI